MRIAVMLLLSIATPLAAAGVRLGPRHDLCGISVRAPRGYVVEKYDDHGHCGIGMKPKGWNEDPSDDAQEDGDYAITLDLAAENFEEAADQAGFLRVKSIRAALDDGTTWPSPDYGDDEWVTMGNSPVFSRAQPIEQKSWTGLIGELTTTFYHRHGGHSGMGPIAIASIVSRGRPPVAVIVRGGALQSDAVRAVVRSIRIRRR
jgi:hypothetical protein